MPVYYPRLLATGSSYCSEVTANCNAYPNPAIQYAASYPRRYRIHGGGRSVYPAYRMTLVLNPLLGQYYGVQGTTWRNPPILDNPTQTVSVKGKHLMEFFNGHKLMLVAWRNAGGVYWISNTLTGDIGNQQLVAIAASLTRAG
jgi:hypothetical protein